MAQEKDLLVVHEQGKIRVVEFMHTQLFGLLVIDKMKEMIDEVISKLIKPKIVLDFAMVDHVGVDAFGMLLYLHNRIKQNNGQLRLVNIKPKILEAFEITKLNRSFRIESDREAGLKSFDK